MSDSFSCEEDKCVELHKVDKKTRSYQRLSHLSLVFALNSSPAAFPLSLQLGTADTEIKVLFADNQELTSMGVPTGQMS